MVAQFRELYLPFWKLDANIRYWGASKLGQNRAIKVLGETTKLSPQGFKIVLKIIEDIAEIKKLLLDLKVYRVPYEVIISRIEFLKDKYKYHREIRIYTEFQFNKKNVVDCVAYLLKEITPDHVKISRAKIAVDLLFNAVNIDQKTDIYKLLLSEKDLSHEIHRITGDGWDAYYKTLEAKPYQYLTFKESGTAEQNTGQI